MVSQRGLETGLSCLGRIAVGMGGLLIVLLVVLEAIQQRMGPILPVARYPVWVRWTLYEMAVLAVLYLGVQGTQQQFIYFQF
jgi:hypothetical protein